MTESEWMTLAARISALWPHQPLSPEAAQVWWPFLKDLDAETVRARVDGLARTHRWGPALADLLPSTGSWVDALLRVQRGEWRDDPVLAPYVESLGGSFGAKQVNWTDARRREEFRLWWERQVSVPDLPALSA